MCGRYTLRISQAEMRAVFDVVREMAGFQFQPRYNVSPTSRMPVIRMNAQGERELTLMRWGFVPRWEPNPLKGRPLTLARAETIAEKKSFKTAFEQHRCLVPADGYIEFEDRGPKDKWPYLFQLGRPFAFAGIWESWTADDGTALECFSLITTDPNELARDIADRMPVILHPVNLEDWLTNPTKAPRLLQTYPANEMQRTALSKLVNSNRSDSPECLEPLT